MGLGTGTTNDPFIEPSEDPRDSVPRAPSAIELHIDELVLHGFSASDRFVIGDAVQKELLRLFGEHGWAAFPRRQSAIERLDAGSFKVVPGAQAHTLGTQLAQSLHRRLTSTEKRQLRQARMNEARKIR